MSGEERKDVKKSEKENHALNLEESAVLLGKSLERLTSEFGFNNIYLRKNDIFPDNAEVDGKRVSFMNIPEHHYRIFYNGLEEGRKNVPSGKQRF